MNTLIKLFTAVRGGVRESAETVIDANAIRILSQEIHESEVAVAKAKSDLTNVIAERIRLKREIKNLTSSILDREAQTATALINNHETDARELAKWIADNEPILIDLKNKYQQLNQYESELKKSLMSVVRQIEHYHRELRLAQATDSSQKATRRLLTSAGNLDTKLSNINSTLQRIHSKQQDFVDIVAARENVELTLDNGNIPKHSVHMLPKTSVDDVLKKIKEKT
jgi:phage shock protein A